MNVIKTAIPDVMIIEPKVFGDARGFFYESFNQRQFEELTGVSPVFVQDNHSRSARGVLRGLHYQMQQTQGKLVRVTSGDPVLGIEWPLQQEPLLSVKDKAGVPLASADVFA